MSERRTILGPDRPPKVIITPSELAGVPDYNLIHPRPLEQAKSLTAVGVVIEEVFSSRMPSIPGIQRRTYYTIDQQGSPVRPQQVNIRDLEASDRGVVENGLSGQKERVTAFEGPAHSQTHYEKFIKADPSVVRRVAAGATIDVPEPGNKTIEATVYVPASIYETPNITQQLWPHLRVSAQDVVSGHTNLDEVAVSIKGDEGIVMDFIGSNYVFKPDTITRLNAATEANSPQAETAARFERRFLAA